MKDGVGKLFGITAAIPMKSAVRLLHGWEYPEPGSIIGPFDHTHVMDRKQRFIMGDRTQQHRAAEPQNIPPNIPPKGVVRLFMMLYSRDEIPLILVYNLKSLLRCFCLLLHSILHRHRHVGSPHSYIMTAGIYRFVATTMGRLV